MHQNSIKTRIYDNKLFYNSCQIWISGLNVLNFNIFKIEQPENNKLFYNSCQIQIFGLDVLNFKIFKI